MEVKRRHDLKNLTSAMIEVSTTWIFTTNADIDQKWCYCCVSQGEVVFDGKI